MPYKYRRKGRSKYYRKRRYPYYRRRRNARNKLTVYKFPGVSSVPDMLITKLKYSDQLTLGNNVTPSFTNVFTLNGLFDVDITNVGHQPMGFDQFMRFYDRYEVRASKIMVQITNQEVIETTVSVYPSETITPAAGINDAVEQNYGKNITIASNESGGTKILRNYMTIRKLEGRQINSANFTGTATSNPTSTRYWILQGSSIDGNNIDIALHLNLIYYVRFYKRRALTGS